MPISRDVSQLLKSQRSIGSVSLQDKVSMKIKQYNIDAKKVQAVNKQQLFTHMKKKFDDLLEKDTKSLERIPGNLCDNRTKDMFMQAKKNIASRRIRDVIFTRTRDEWQLP